MSTCFGFWVGSTWLKLVSFGGLDEVFLGVPIDYFLASLGVGWGTFERRDGPRYGGRFKHCKLCGKVDSLVRRHI